MTDPSVERFVWVRAGERSIRSVLSLVEERFGSYEELLAERPLTPVERLRRGA